MSKVIRVVPVPAAEGMAAKTGGTAVYVGEERIKGVQKLTLIAEPNNVWRAIIETTVQMDGEIVAAVQSAATPTIEVTCIEDRERKHMDPVTGVVTGAGTWRGIDHGAGDEMTAYPAPPKPPPSRLICDCCGDVTEKPHKWICRLVVYLFGRAALEADYRRRGKS